ncbi:MAG: hypothetical protein KF690_09715 [Bacteroidetes bacterium]|nr:hypothetical protein [Bacteroidota bacterium]
MPQQIARISHTLTMVWDILFVLFMALLQPGIYSVLERSAQGPAMVIRLVMVLILMADVCVLLPYTRHLRAMQARSVHSLGHHRNWFLAILCLGRMVLGSLPVLELQQQLHLPDGVWITCLALWGLAQLFYLACFVSKDQLGIAAKELSPGRYMLYSFLLFLSMCSLSVYGVGLLPVPKGLQVQQLLHMEATELLAFLGLVLLVYLPARLFQFADEGMIARTPLQWLYYGLRILFMLIILALLLLLGSQYLGFQYQYRVLPIS